MSGPGFAQTLWIEGSLPGLNEIIGAGNTHRHQGARLKKDFTDTCTIEAKKQLQPIANCWVDLKFVWYERDHRRDLDNIAAGAKFILDGLTRAGILPNDTQEYVRSIHHHLIGDDFRDDKVGVRVEIWPGGYIKKPRKTRGRISIAEEPPDHVVTIPMNPKRQIKWSPRG